LLADYSYIIQILTSLGIGTVLGYFIKFFLDRSNLQLANRHRIAEKLAEKVIEYTEKYYVPLASSLANLAFQLDRTLENPTDEEKRYSFYLLAVCLSARGHLATEAIGLILKNVEIERRLELIYRNFIDEIKNQAKITLQDISAIEKLVSLKELAYDFLLKMNGDRTLNEIYHKFDQWLRNTDSVKRVIKYAADQRDLFVSELNLIYEPWYGKASKQKPPVPCL